VWLLLIIPISTAVEFLLRSVRWRRLLGDGHGMSFSKIVSITSGGFFLNNVLPFRAGEAARLMWTWKGTGRPIASCAAVLGLDRLFDMMAIATLMLIAATGWRGAAWAGDAAVTLGAAVICGTGLLWAMARFPDRASAAANGLRLPARLRSWISDFSHGAAPLADFRVFIGVYLLTMGFWVMTAGVFALISRVFGLDLSFVEGAALVVSFAVGAALPSAPGYVGVLEAAGVSFLMAAGRPRVESGAFVLVLHAGQILTTALYGIPALFSIGMPRTSRD
jgi:uncharacterized protein (TIRG00374 family)